MFRCALVPLFTRFESVDVVPQVLGLALFLVAP